jgi:hypothetical protein
VSHPRLARASPPEPFNGLSGNPGTHCDNTPNCATRLCHAGALVSRMPVKVDKNWASAFKSGSPKKGGQASHGEGRRWVLIHLAALKIGSPLIDQIF